MTKFLFLAAVACVIGCSAPANNNAAAACTIGCTAPANYNAFGVAVVQRIAANSRNSNVFVSPVSLGVGLAMVADGAAGSTRASLLRGLRLPGRTWLVQMHRSLLH